MGEIWHVVGFKLVKFVFWERGLIAYQMYSVFHCDPIFVNNKNIIPYEWNAFISFIMFCSSFTPKLEIELEIELF